jgi:hypothetical protein
MQFPSDSNAFNSSSSQTASLPSSPIESILPSATPSVAGTKRGVVPKRRFQKGTFVKRRGNWIGMWRVDTLQSDGTIRREQRSQTFLGLSERAARAAFQPILDAVNAANHATPPVPKTSDTVAKAHTRVRTENSQPGVLRDVRQLPVASSDSVSIGAGSLGTWDVKWRVGVECQRRK